MSEPDPEEAEPDPESLNLSEGFAETLGKRTTLDKMYDVAVQLYESTRVSDVAEQADVTPETARKYLEFYAEIGIVNRTGEDPDEFKRNDRYFDWRKTERLRREHTVADLEDRLEELSHSIQKLKSRFGVSSPEDVDPRSQGYENVDEVYSDLRRWRDMQDEIDRILSVLDTEAGTAGAVSNPSPEESEASAFVTYPGHDIPESYNYIFFGQQGCDWFTGQNMTFNSPDSLSTGLLDLKSSTLGVTPKLPMMDAAGQAAAMTFILKNLIDSSPDIRVETEDYAKLIDAAESGSEEE